MAAPRAQILEPNGGHKCNMGSNYDCETHHGHPYQHHPYPGECSQAIANGLPMGPKGFKEANTSKVQRRTQRVRTRPFSSQGHNGNPTGSGMEIQSWSHKIYEIQEAFHVFPCSGKGSSVRSLNPRKVMKVPPMGRRNPVSD